MTQPSGRRWRAWPAGLLLCLVATPALANSALPMLVLAWPAQALAFVPVVMLETWMLARMAALSWRQTWRPVVWANVVSTLVGVPVAWVVWVVMESGLRTWVHGAMPPALAQSAPVQGLLWVFQSAWLRDVGTHQMQLAFAVLALPLCLVSALVEWRVLRARLAVPEGPSLWRPVWVGNVLSYGLLCVAVALALALAGPGAGRG